MKKLLAAMFVALLMAGCGDPDLDDKETLDGIIAEAIDDDKLQARGKEGEELLYAPNQKTPYTGWSKLMYDDGQIEALYQYKDGKEDGLGRWWYRNGQLFVEDTSKDGKSDGPARGWYSNGEKEYEGTHKDGKLMTFVGWKPNGEKCPVTNVVNGNGSYFKYHENGKKAEEGTYKDGKLYGVVVMYNEDGTEKRRMRFFPPGRTAAVIKLKTIYETLVQETRSFPMNDDVKSADEFAVWFRNKTKETCSELWFIQDDEEVRALEEDKDAKGIPANIPDDANDFDHEQKKAMAWCVAIPGDNAETRSFVVNLRSGAFPIIWTRGLGRGDQNWPADSPWADEGGHVLFSDGTVLWYNDTKGKDEEGVFARTINREDDKDKKAESTDDIGLALPKGWEIYDPSD